MRYPQEVIEEIRTGNDIVDLVSSYVPLKQKGSNYFGLCPFHNEKSPSFSVSSDKQIYYCFGCGASGNAIGFVMQMENYEFIEAVKFLADRIHYQLPEREFTQEARQGAEDRERIFEINTLAARFFYNTLNSADGKQAESYLDKRGLSPKIRKKYGLGYALHKWDGMYKYLLEQGYDIDLILKSGLVLPDKRGGYYDRFVDRLMFPIFNPAGKIVGFGGRILENGEPKYLNSPDTPVFDKSKNLYGINFARQSRNRNLIVVEGYMDVISLAQAGFSNTVAALGTAFNNDHAGVLKKYADSVILLFDSDEAGTKASLRAINVLVENGIKTKVLQVKGAKDPDEFIKSFGRDAFSDLLQTAVSYITFQVECLKKNYDLEKTDERVQFVLEVAKILAKLENAVEREAYTSEISGITGISQNSITTEIKKIADKSLGDINSTKKQNLPYIQQDKIKEKGIREAQKEILSLTAENILVYEAINGLLLPEDMPDEVYAKLLSYIYRVHRERRTWYVAEALNYFTEIGDQQKIAEIFVGGKGFMGEVNDPKQLETVINGAFRRIKNFCLDQKLAKVERAEDLQKLIESKRKIEATFITFADKG